MRELQHDLWTVPDTDAIVITTNGFIKKNGEAVMGRGCALEAVKKYPQLAKTLANHIKACGNVVGVTGYVKSQQPVPKKGMKVLFPPIIFFPVKHNWWERADLDLIRQSRDKLIELVNNARFKKVIVPRPGVGNGRHDGGDRDSVTTRKHVHIVYMIYIDCVKMSITHVNVIT